MKLAAIYNCWDGIELLGGSINCIKDHVDLILIVVQKISNKGEYYNPVDDLPTVDCKPVVLFYSPDLTKTASWNERAKRQSGVDYVKELGYTHFINMDCDEYYEDFGRAKEDYLKLNPNGGSVCKMFTYFKNPTLRFENEDNYYVPFIHKIEQETKLGSRSYPFYCDPTRLVNSSNVIELENVRMHHFSWVRKNISRKINNSSANLARSPKLLQDYYSPETKSGYYVEGFHQKLIEVENKFNIEI